MIVEPCDYLGSANASETWNDMSRYQWDGAPHVVGRLLFHQFYLCDLFVRKTNGVNIPAGFDLDILQFKVDQLWAEYQHETEHSSYAIQLATAGQPQYRDELTAITVAHFASARMLQFLVGISYPVIGQDIRAAVDCQVEIILGCSTFLSSKPTNCMTLRMFFPLTLIALYNTEHKRRMEAYRYMENWLEISAFSGLCKVVKDKMEKSPLVC
jgi:hypothetical protein